MTDAGKRYYISTRSERTLFKTLRRKVTGQESQRELWALRHVNLDVKHGEILGIIGPNGAGKTTLLLLMSKIMDPTEGDVRSEGEIRSPFLGLGSALQAELSVEDNIRLCAALLGMPRKTCQERMERIVAFGDLEPYRYAKLMELSSGYQGRVAFSVAFHTDCDVIISDESLGSGDVRFREKCARMFEKYVSEKKTIIITSHEMEFVRELCHRCIYLSEGKVKALGNPDEVTALFEKDCALEPNG